MNTKLMQETTSASYGGRMTFPEVVQALAGIGVESYVVDFLKNEKTFYTANGETFTEKLPGHKGRVPERFEKGAVQEAIRCVQRREMHYPKFVEKILAAGTAGYTVYITGRRAIYFGRSGDFHVEEFPGK